MKSYCNLKKFAKIALNHKIEEVVEIEVEHKIEEVVEIEVEHKIVEEVLGQFGGFWSTLRRFLQAGSTFCGLFSQISFGGFLLPFLRSIFDPFWDFSLRAICLFYGTFSISRCLLDPFSDDFLTVHLVTILPTLGPCWSGPCLRVASRRLA
jgi:hypothetical protein